jgi:general stress protein 26
MPFASWCLSLALVLLPQSAPTQVPTRDAILAASRTIITNARYATVVTMAGAAEPDARIIDPFAPEADLTIWFATKASSRKVQQLAQDSRVTLLYFDAATKGYVTLKGRAALVRDPKEKSARWKEDWAGMYTNKNLGDDYRLVRVVPDTLEVVSMALGMINDPATWRPVTLKLK